MKAHRAFQDLRPSCVADRPGYTPGSETGVHPSLETALRKGCHEDTLTGVPALRNTECGEEPRGTRVPGGSAETPLRSVGSSVSVHTDDERETSVG